jgi:hypothetical protein
MQKKHGVEMQPKDRFRLLKEFERSVQDRFNLKSDDFRFKILKNIEDPDEQMEGIHRLRQFVRHTMGANEALNLINMA